jgi:hypothetical protein
MAHGHALEAFDVASDASEHLACDRRQARGGRRLDDAVQRFDQPARRGVGKGSRAMPGRPLGDEAKPENLLLGHGNEQRGRRQHVGDADAAFVPHGRRLEQVGALLCHPRRAKRAAHFLVRNGEEHQIVLRQLAACDQQAQGDELSDGEPLHVECAASVDDSVADLAGERRKRPARCIGRHDIHVVEQHDWLAAAAAAAAHAADQNRLAGVGCDALRGDPDLAELAGEEVGGGARVAGRIGCVDANVVGEQRRRLRGRRLPVRLTSSAARCDEQQDRGGDRAHGSRRAHAAQPVAHIRRSLLRMHARRYPVPCVRQAGAGILP